MIQRRPGKEDLDKKLNPLQTYNLVSNSSSSGFLNPDATPPSSGKIHGLKHDKNLSDS